MGNLYSTCAHPSIHERVQTAQYNVQVHVHSTTQNQRTHDTHTHTARHPPTEKRQYHRLSLHSWQQTTLTTSGEQKRGCPRQKAEMTPKSKTKNSAGLSRLLPRPYRLQLSQTGTRSRRNVVGKHRNPVGQGGGVGGHRDKQHKTEPTNEQRDRHAQEIKKTKSRKR